MDPLPILLELARIPTVSDPARGRLVDESQGRMVADVLARYGLEAELHVDGGIPTLLAVRGEGRPVTLFMAHFDVVPPGPGWTRDPFNPTVEGDRVYARGAADDKSNVAAITAALAGYEPEKGTIIIAFTGDEEIGGSHGAGWLAGYLERQGMLPDYLVNGDGSLSRVITRRRNAFTATIQVKREPATASGRLLKARFQSRLQRETMHSAYLVPGVDTHALVAASLWARDRDTRIASLDGEWVKTNVVPRTASIEYVAEGPGSVDYDEALTRLVHAIVPLSRAPIPVEKYSDYGVTVNPNMYSLDGETHTLKLDIRAMTGDKSRVEAALENIVEEALPGARLNVAGGKGYLYTPASARLVKLAVEANETLGLPGNPIEAGGASDSRYFSPKGVEAIDYGPLGGNIHGPDEWVSVTHLRLAAKFYRMIAERLHSE